MQYQGGKNKLAKQLLEVIPRNGEIWVEPFVGGCGMIRNVSGVSRKIGADNNRYVISLWKAVQSGWEPPYITKEEYDDIRSNLDKFDPELTAFAAIGCSFRGAWFNGYATTVFTKDGVTRNYVDEARRAIIKLSPKIQDVEFVNCSYDELEIPPNSIIYCDPPYQNTKKYKDDFDHVKFWGWCRRKSREGFRVYISEQSAPDDFTCIKEIIRSSTMDHKSATKTTEKLFIYDPEGINEPTNRDK